MGTLVHQKKDVYKIKNSYKSSVLFGTLFFCVNKAIHSPSGECESNTCENCVWKKVTKGCRLGEKGAKLRKRGEADMFLGEFIHALDEKGRLTIPSKFRKDLNDQCVIAKGLDGCLSIYPMKEWEILVEKLDQKPSSDVRVRRFKRQFFASASVEGLDRQGRLSIPQQLLDYAGISRDVSIIGESNIIELWSEERWHRQLAEEGEESFENLAAFLEI